MFVIYALVCFSPNVIKAWTANWEGNNWNNWDEISVSEGFDQAMVLKIIP